jgi:branched-chain amino acid transport system substrate-binding protein
MAAMADASAWYNEQGGIDGVPVRVVTRDTEYKLDLAIAAYNTFREVQPKPLVMFTWGSAECEALASRYAEDEIVGYMFALTTKAIYPPAYMFPFAPGYVDTFGAWVDWVVDVWQKKTGMPVKLAFCTWDNAYGRSVFAAEGKEYAKKRGVEIVAEEVFPTLYQDVTTQMTRIKGTGANWVYDNTLSHGPGVVSKAAKALGILANDPFDTSQGKIRRATGPFPGGSDEATVRLAGDLAEGMIMLRAYASYAETDNKGIQFLDQLLQKNNRAGAQFRVAGYLAGVAGLYTAAETIKKVVAAGGWENLNGKAVKEQFEKTTDFDVLSLGKVSFTPDKHEPTKLRLYQVQGGKLIPITEFVTCPDLRPAEYRK